MNKQIMQGLKSNSGLTLIELIVSMVVSSVVILSAVMFFSFTLTQYRNTAQETDLMMESQIAVNAIREVVMEAAEPIQKGTYTAGTTDYPWFSVVTERGFSDDGVEGERFRHLFFLDTERDILLYYKGSETAYSSSEEVIANTLFSDGVIDNEDRKQWYLSDYVRSVSIEQPGGGRLVLLELLFHCDDRTYHANETISMRNESALLRTAR